MAAPALTLASAFFLAAVSLSPSAQAQVAASPRDKHGYWWYEAPPKPAPKEEASEEVAKPRIPPMAELATYGPPKIRKLIEQQRDYAATVLTIDAVADFWKLEDFARRKARAFAGVTQIAMLQHPELNPRGAYPLVNNARSELLTMKEDLRREYLRARANEFAIVMLSRSTCNYCRVQWPILQRFTEQFGWQVTLVDIDQHPDVALRFGAEVTPMSIVIRRNSQQSMVVATGIEAFDTVAQNAYQVVRLLRGDIQATQFMNGPGEDHGFFDALNNGPVASTDPAAMGMELVNASAPVKP